MSWERGLEEEWPLWRLDLHLSRAHRGHRWDLTGTCQGCYAQIAWPVATEPCSTVHWRDGKENRVCQLTILQSTLQRRLEGVDRALAKARGRD